MSVCCLTFNITIIGAVFVLSAQIGAVQNLRIAVFYCAVLKLLFYLRCRLSHSLASRAVDAHTVKVFTILELFKIDPTIRNVDELICFVGIFVLVYYGFSASVGSNSAKRRAFLAVPEIVLNAVKPSVIAVEQRALNVFRAEGGESASVQFYA